MFRFSRPRRLSLRSRSALGVLAIVAVFCAIWWGVYRTVVPPTPLIEVPRETVTFETLRPEDEIVVILARASQSPLELRFRATGEERRVFVSELRWSEGDRSWKMQRELTRLTLASGQMRALDRLLLHLRSARVADHSGRADYTLILRRGEVSVGRETFGITPLLRALDHLRTADPSDAVASESRREDLAREARLAGFPPAEVAAWTTFEQLAAEALSASGG